MKSSFKKRVKRPSKNQRCNANAKFGDKKKKKNSSQIYIYIYIYLYIFTYIYVCEKLFTKNTIFELGIDIASSFSGMALKRFLEKSSSNIPTHVTYMYLGFRGTLLDESS